MDGSLLDRFDKRIKSNERTLASLETQEAPSGSGGVPFYSPEVLSGEAPLLFSSPEIPSNYFTLIITGIIRSVEPDLLDPLRIRFNGDESANYERVITYVGGTTPATMDEYTANAWTLGNVLGGTAEAGNSSVFRLEIPGYSSGTLRKAGFWTTTAVQGAVATDGVYYVGAGSWRSTAPIISFVLFLNSGYAFAAGSQIVTRLIR